MMELLEIFKAILFGIVEGVTEWLPVSSTGHLILLNEYVQLNVSESFFKMFEVVIQLGAILAVVLLYWQKLWPFEIKRQKIKNRIAVAERVVWKEGGIDLWVKIIVCCIPAAIVGIVFDDKIDELFYHPLPVALALIIVGVLFIAIEMFNKDRTFLIDSVADMPYRVVLLIGAAQTLAAVFPGTSRSGSTILAGILLGVSRTCAAEFTFFLAVPVMFGASLLKVVKYIHDGLAISQGEILTLIVGCITAFAVSILTIRFLMKYIQNHDFKAFGIYRIVLGIAVIALLH